jgi:hypothetical protein
MGPKETPKQEIENIKLEEVLGSSMCQYTVIENKLATLYKNQEQILKAIKLLNNQNKEIPDEDFNHLEWIYNRLISVHNESPNYDYMLKFKSLIKEFKKK